MNAPEVLSESETALELNDDGWALYRVGDEGQLRDGDGRIVLSGPWVMVPAWVQREFSVAEAETAADRGPVHDSDDGRVRA